MVDKNSALIDQLNKSKDSQIRQYEDYINEQKRKQNIIDNLNVSQNNFFKDMSKQSSSKK